MFASAPAGGSRVACGFVGEHAGHGGVYLPVLLGFRQPVAFQGLGDLSRVHHVGAGDGAAVLRDAVRGQVGFESAQCLVDGSDAGAARHAPWHISIHAPQWGATTRMGIAFHNMEAPSVLKTDFIAKIHVHRSIHKFSNQKHQQTIHF